MEEREHKPYTLEQLHLLGNGVPVYTKTTENMYGWALLDYKDGELIAIRCLAEDGTSAEYLHEDDYDKTWKAYSNDISPWEHD